MSTLKSQMSTAMRNIVSQKGKLSLEKEDSLDKEIKRLEVASQTPKERRARQNRRWHMLKNKPVS
jgi:hypothetical protein